MEDNLINISEGYKAVLLPKDAENLRILNKNRIINRQLDTEPIRVLKWEDNEVNISNMEAPKEITIPLNSELIGTLDTLTEDQARDILKWGPVDKDFDILKHLREIISSRFGIQTENPLKKPDMEDYGIANILGPDKDEAYKRDFLAWEASERSTKQILIIKTKE